jgi:hypothetical protein
MRRLTYWWEITGVLFLKVIGISLLYFLFFTTEQRPAATEQAVAQHVLVAQAPGAGGQWGLR